MNRGAVLKRCHGCNAVLITDEGGSVRFSVGELRMFKDTGKITCQCRRCPVSTVLDPGVLPIPVETDNDSQMTRRVRVAVLALAGG